MKHRLLPSVVVAGVTSALAVTINIATSPQQPWWAWAGVAVLTCIAGLLSSWTQRTPDPRRSADSRPAPDPRRSLEVDESRPRQGSTTNTISGEVSGNVVQANTINGDVTF